ncbi:MAG: hypothetical protein ACHP9Z_05465 [Streptosporangiales bacterium]
MAWSEVVNVAATNSGDGTGGPSAGPAEAEAEAGLAPEPAPPAAAAANSRAPASWLRGRRGRRWLTAAILAALTGLLYACYVARARSLGIDSDGASNVLQAWDMIHGNPLLRSWWLSDVSFYTTELPEYVLVELAHGLNPGDVYLATAATYTLLVLLAAVLAKGRATGTEALLRVLVTVGIMLAPGPRTTAGLLLSSPEHVGTGVPLLLIWLAIDRLGGRRYLPWLVGVLLTWVQIADQMAVYVGALPVIVVSAIRLYQFSQHGHVSPHGNGHVSQPEHSSQQGRRAAWLADAGLLVAAAVSVPLAAGLVSLIRHAGGFVVAPTTTIFATSAQLPHNFWLMVESVLALFGADFFGMRPGPLLAVALLRLIAVILAAWACCLAARRLRSERGRLIPILITAILINLAAFTFSTQAFDLASARDISAVLPFSAVLAGRLLPGRAALRALAPALLAVAVGYAGIAGYYAGSPRQPIETQAVAAWLSAHHQTAGLGGYWSANLTTVATSDRVRVRAVTSSCHRFIPDVWETKKTWYQPPGRATFLVLGLSQVAGANGTAAQATAQFGPPQRNVRIGSYRVMVWNHDLLPALTSGFAPGCGPRWRR